MNKETEYKNVVIINGTTVSKLSTLWSDTVDRVSAFEKKYPNPEDFKKHMLTRLKRIKYEVKIYYTIAVLLERGHNDVAEIYDAQLVMNALTRDL